MVNEYQWLWMGYYCDIKNRYSWINISGKQQNFCRFSGAAICESLLLELDGRPLVLGRLEGVHLGMLGSHGVLIPCEMCEIWWNFCHVVFWHVDIFYWLVLTGTGMDYMDSFPQSLGWWCLIWRSPSFFRLKPPVFLGEEFQTSPVLGLSKLGRAELPWDYGHPNSDASSTYVTPPITLGHLSSFKSPVVYCICFVGYIDRCI